LKEVRDEIFPFKKEVVLSDDFCKTKDESAPQEFLQGKYEVRVPVNK
jgi:hypothetical protein